MIPKIIHYCWFGDAAIPEETIQYMQEWKQLNPDWTLMLWNEKNSPMDLRYMQQAYTNREWANLSNLTRLYALLKFGGIYLDTDMKLLKPLNSLCNCEVFFGFEEGGEDADVFWVNNAICGAIKNHPFINSAYEYLLESYDGTEKANLSGPRLITSLLKEKKGLKKYGYQELDGITLFPKQYFYPIHYSEVYKISNLNRYIFPETIAVHVWARTWLTREALLSLVDDLYQLNHGLVALSNNKENGLSDENKLNKILDLFHEMTFSGPLSKSVINEYLSIINGLRNQLSLLQQEYIKLISQKNLLTDENSRLQLEKQNLSNAISLLEMEIKHKENDLAEIMNRYQSKLKDLETANEDLKLKSEKLLLANDLLQREKQNNSFLQNEIKKTVFAFEEFKKSQLDLQKQLVSLNESNQLLQKQLDKDAVLSKEKDLHIRSLEERIDLSRSTVSELEKELSFIKDQMETAVGQFKKILDEKNQNEKEYLKEIDNNKNNIKSLNKAISWYQSTFQYRSTAGIIKDRFYKKISSVPYFKHRISGYHKIKTAKRSNKLSSRVLCSIVNYNCTENALRLRQSLSMYFDTVVFDSGSQQTSSRFINLGNVYYSGLLNNSYLCAREKKYDFLFFICSDVEFNEEEIHKMVRSLQSVDLSSIGVYSPASTGRSHFFCKKQFDRGLRVVPFTEGFVFLANMQVLKQFLPLDLHVNQYGWGLDVAKGYFSRKIDLLSVVDDSVTVYHPESTGYSNQRAEDDMWHWVNTFNDEDFKRFLKKNIELIRLGKQNNPKVSVIVPCFNQGAYLEETIKNLLLQEYTNLEILIINDGSFDNTEEITLNYAAQYPQIKYYAKKNGGLGNTRNYGLNVSTGEYIQFLDSDDLMSKDKLLNQIHSIAIDPSIEVSYTPYICFEDGNKNNTWTYSRVVLNNDPLADLIENWEKELSIPVHCFLYKKSAIANIFFDEELPNHEDWLFHIYIAARRVRYHFEGAGLAYYRVRTNSMARDKNLMIKGKEMCVRKAINSGILDDGYINKLKGRLQ